jgi:hypothetical protein
MGRNGVLRLDQDQPKEPEPSSRARLKDRINLTRQVYSISYEAVTFDCLHHSAPHVKHICTRTENMTNRDLEIIPRNIYGAEGIAP